MDIITYLNTLGFTHFKQTDEYGWFIDKDYVTKNGFYAELHDDNMFFFWVDVTNPLIAVKITPENLYKTRLQCCYLFHNYSTIISIK